MQEFSRRIPHNRTVKQPIYHSLPKWLAGTANEPEHQRKPAGYRPVDAGQQHGTVTAPDNQTTGLASTTGEVRHSGMQPVADRLARDTRSEEHTSELQSQSNLL